jgi:hypothetical protein
MANIVYLDEHGLVEGGIQFGTDGHAQIGAPRITHRGMDFIMGDGGLSAILGVVTIKLHEDTLKELIALKIQESTASQPDKKKWLDALRELPAESTKHLALKLIDLGLSQWPGALHALQTYL